jgi:amino acid transporter
MQPVQTRLRRFARITVGVLLVIQTIMFAGWALFLGMFIPTMGGMAMIVGGGKATDEQFEKAWWAIWAMAASPFLVVVLCGIMAWLVLRNRRPWLLYACVAIALLLYIPLANFVMEGHWSHVRLYGLMPVLFPLAGALLVSRPGSLKQPDVGPQGL